MQLCFTVELQNCSVDYDTSPDFISSGGGEDDRGYMFLGELFLKK